MLARYVFASVAILMPNARLAFEINILVRFIPLFGWVSLLEVWHANVL